MNTDALIAQATASYNALPWVASKLGLEGPNGDKKHAVAQSGITEVKGRHYVVLINAWGDVLAAYKVEGEALKEMRRIPIAVEADPRWADLVQERRRFKRNFSAYANRNATIHF